MAGSEPRPLAIWLEQFSNLVLLGERTGIAATEHPAGELEQPEIARWHLIVAALPVQSKHL